MENSIALLKTVCLGLAIILAAGTCMEISSQDLTRNDIDAIEYQYTSYADALVNSDAESAVATYADQAVEIFPNLTSNVGKSNILSRYNGMMSVSDFTRSDVKPEWIEGTGSLAVVMGKHAFTYVNRGSDRPDQIQGYHSQIFRKQADGAWKTLAIHYRNVPIDQPIPKEILDVDRQQIRQIIKSYETIPTEYEPQEAVGKFADLYSDQAVIIWPSQRSLVGKPNLKVTFQQATSNYKIVEIKMGTLGLGGVGEMAIAYGKKTETHDPVDGDELETFTRPWAMIFAKVPDEGWKILAVHWAAM